LELIDLRRSNETAEKRLKRMEEARILAQKKGKPRKIYGVVMF
jgi:hypothetical protein